VSRPERILLPCKAGRDVLVRYGFGAEASTTLDDSAHNGVEDLVKTAHAPYSGSEGRFSIADVNDDLREEAIGRIEAYIEGAKARFPNLEKINMHCSPKRWASDDRPLKGEYDRLIDGIRRVGAKADQHGLTVAVENNRAYWEGVGEEVSADQVDREAQDEYFGVEPDEWIAVQRDVDRPNVFLCLDTSHACTYTQTAVDPEDRKRLMLRYLDAGDALRHVHWNGNDLLTNVGRQDTHMSLHKDDLPDELHARLKGWDATLLLEHWYGEEALEGELSYIESL
jgi:sugar phosphate isomerase/epimerase